MEKSSKVYVAGHNGMVGSAITRKLTGMGHTNLVFTPYPPYDLMDQSTVKEFFEKEKPEYVFLAAAKVGGIVANNKYRAQFLYENLMIQNNIIHQSFLNGVKKLLFLGSSCIYPKNCPQPIKEEYLLTGELEYTNEPYAIAKIAGLKMCESYNIQYGTNFIAVMPTNLYGPNDNYNLETSHVLPAMIRKIHLGKCLEENDWLSIRNDLKKRPIEEVNDQSGKEEILSILSKYGIQLSTNTKPETLNAEPGTLNAEPGTLNAERLTLNAEPGTLNAERGTLNAERLTRNPEPITITLWGTGSPYREFLHVDDVADACVFTMNNVDFADLKNKTSGSGEIRNTHINIGTGKDMTIRELAMLIKEVVGFKGDIIWDHSKPDGTPRKLLDVSKINNLGWHEKIELGEGVKGIYLNNFQ